MSCPPLEAPQLSLSRARVADVLDRRQHDLGVRHTHLVTIADAMKASLILKLGMCQPVVNHFSTVWCLYPDISFHFPLFRLFRGSEYEKRFALLEPFQRVTPSRNK